MDFEKKARELFTPDTPKLYIEMVAAALAAFQAECAKLRMFLARISVHEREAFDIPKALQHCGELARQALSQAEAPPPIHAALKRMAEALETCAVRADLGYFRESINAAREALADKDVQAVLKAAGIET